MKNEELIMKIQKLTMKNKGSPEAETTSTSFFIMSQSIINV